MESFVEIYAPEFVAYQAANKAWMEDDMNLDLLNKEEAAFKVFVEAIRPAAEIALHWNGKVSKDAHESADQNALDTLGEYGINPDSDVGRLIYYRFYVSQLDI